MAVTQETIIDISTKAARRGDVILNKIVDKNTLAAKGDLLVGTGGENLINGIGVAGVDRLSLPAANGLPIVSNLATASPLGVEYGQIVTAGIADDAVTKAKINADVVNTTTVTVDGLTVGLVQDNDGSIKPTLTGNVTSATNDANGKAITTYISGVSVSDTNLVVVNGAGATVGTTPITALKTRSLQGSAIDLFYGDGFMTVANCSLSSSGATALIDIGDRDPSGMVAYFYVQDSSAAAQVISAGYVNFLTVALVPIWVTAGPMVLTVTPMKSNDGNSVQCSATAMALSPSVTWPLKVIMAY